MTARASIAYAVLATIAAFPSSGLASCEIGLNLPATQGTSNAGNFEPGVFQFGYTNTLLARIEGSPFTQLRLSLNAETAQNKEALDKLDSLAQATDYRGILCMWDTNEVGETGHGNGLPNDLDELARAWKAVHAQFGKHPHLRYEILNEPFGYPRNLEGARRYLEDMRYIIEQAELPEQRCILDGLGYADNIRLVSEAGWKGALAYHLYPNWLPAHRSSSEEFKKLLISALDGIPNEIVITEFGTSLNKAISNHGETSLIPGLALAMHQLRQSGSQITAAYLWHGWDNGDAYSYWHPDNAHGAASIHSLQLQGKPSTTD